MDFHLSEHLSLKWYPSSQIVKYNLMIFFLLKMSIQDILYRCYVPGLSCRKLDSCYWFVLMIVMTTFPMESPIPFYWFHPFHVTFIYAMNWMIFLFVSLLFSFDEYIIALPLVFVNTFFIYFYNKLFIIYLICFKTIIFLYFHLNSDNSIV